MSTNTSIEAGLANANIAFLEGYANYFSKPLPGVYQTYCETMPTTAEVTELNFLANYPLMREWVGARRNQYARSYSQRIKLKTFESTWEIPRKTIKYRDKLGLIANGLKNWLALAATAYDKDAYLRYMQSSGAGPTGYDGVALFAATHPQGPSGNQSNIGAGLALNSPNLDAAVTAMQSWQLENGEPAGFSPDTLIVGPANKRKAMQLISADSRVIVVDATGKGDVGASAVAATTIPNVYNGEMTLIVDMRRIGSAQYYWDLLDTQHPGVRPMMQLVGQAPTPINQDQLESPKRFSRDAYVYGLEGDWVFDAGFWMSAYRGTATALG